MPYAPSQNMVSHTAHCKCRCPGRTCSTMNDDSLSVVSWQAEQQTSVAGIVCPSTRDST